MDPLAPKPTHFPAKAKSVIWLHQFGAPSTLDLYDYKPDLIKLAGQDVPPSFLTGIKTSTQGGVGKLFATKRTWKQYGESGAWFSDLLPNLAQQADKIAFIKASKTIGATHDISVLKLNTGDLNPGRPSLGAWVQYALGSANPDLPAYVVLYSGRREPEAGSVNWSSGFLPAVYQGIAFRPGNSPILNVDRQDVISAAQQRDGLDLLRHLNQLSADRHPADTELRARLNSYDLAYRMESSAPEAVDVSKESAATQELYGLNDEESKDYGTVLLRARRLVERKVRFVHVVTGHVDVDGDSQDWDAHRDLEKNHGVNAQDSGQADCRSACRSEGARPARFDAGRVDVGVRPDLLRAERQRTRSQPLGLHAVDGRWRREGGLHLGQTDEIGLKSVGKAVDTYDLHATVLNQLGLDHLKVTFLNNGRSERPTVVYGEVVKELVA